MTDRVQFKIDARLAGTRADTALAETVKDISRSLARSLILDGKALVNGLPTKPSRRLSTGDDVVVELALPPSISAEPEPISLSVVYQDRDLAVVDKPPGLVVHPAAGHASGTLANALTALFPQTQAVGPADRPGIVHRLDKDTSGLMVVALSPVAHASLQRQISERTAERRYLALVTGHVYPREGSIDAPIGRDPGNRKRMAVHGVAARPARTSYRVCRYLPGFTLLEARLHTGRTHQIRVHFAAMGHPVAGDETYHGASIRGLHRQFLHAHRLVVSSPTTGKSLEFTSLLPGDLARALQELPGGND